MKKESNLLKEQLFLIRLFVHLWVSMPQQIVQMRILLYNLFLPILIMYPAFLMITLLQAYWLANYTKRNYCKSKNPLLSMLRLLASVL